MVITGRHHTRQETEKYIFSSAQGSTLILLNNVSISFSVSVSLSGSAPPTRSHCLGVQAGSASVRRCMEATGRKGLSCEPDVELAGKVVSSCERASDKEREKKSESA